MQRKVSPAEFNARVVVVVGLGVMAEIGGMDAATTVKIGRMGAVTIVEIGGIGVVTTVGIGGMDAGTIALIVAGIVAMDAVTIVVARSRAARPRIRLSANLISNACGAPGGHFARTLAIVRTRKAVPHSARTGGTVGGLTNIQHLLNHERSHLTC
jgi:hypothetical protein